MSTMALPNPTQFSVATASKRLGRDGSRGKEAGTELPGWMLSSSRSSESLASVDEPAAAVVRSVNQEVALAVHRCKEWREMDTRVEEMIRLLSLLDCEDVTELYSLAAGQPSLHPRAKLRLLGLRNKVLLCYIESNFTDFTDDFKPISACFSMYMYGVPDHCQLKGAGSELGRNCSVCEFTSKGGKRFI